MVEAGRKSLASSALGSAPREDAHRAWAVGGRSDCISNVLFSWAQGKPREERFICPINDGFSLSATPEPTDLRHMCISGSPEPIRHLKCQQASASGFRRLVGVCWVNSPNLTTQAWNSVQGASEGKLANTGSRPVHLLKTCATKGQGRHLPRESLPPGTVSHGDTMHWQTKCSHWSSTNASCLSKPAEQLLWRGSLEMKEDRSVRLPGT